LKTASLSSGDGDLHRRARELTARTKTTMDAATDLLHQSRRTLWSLGTRLPTGDFFIEGYLEDGARTIASSHRGRVLCDDALRSRAGLLSAMGEEFHSGSGHIYRANLEGPAMAIALTFIRAMSGVTTFYISLGDETSIS
jgi:hypothetical protein